MLRLRSLQRQPRGVAKLFGAQGHLQQRNVATKPSRAFGPEYDPPSVESGWNEWWESQGFFDPSVQEKVSSQELCRPFTMILPPPNVTGQLHIGHALTCSIQDAIVRWRRMQQYSVQWIPGTDHAGIATQNVVEKYLHRSKNISRTQLGREAFVKEIWQWKNEHGQKITKQLKRLGVSLDWKREYFTLDPRHSEAVTHAFVSMYQDGLIYRDIKMVNWCCALETVVSDIEVEYEELKKKTLMLLPNGVKVVPGLIHYISYTLEGHSDIHITVGTTRPETLLGDTALAIHPEDARHENLHGKYAIHPILGTRIPIICDAILVDPSFGTGVVKVTPAHDPADYQCAQRNGLPIINIMDSKGRIIFEGSEFHEKDRYAVRELLVSKLKTMGLYERSEFKPTSIARCSRSGDILEPMLLPQWFVKTSELAKKVLDDTVAGKIDVTPPSFRNEWRSWLERTTDWCVSRQLWWGHRIPAYKIIDRESSKSDERERWVVARSPEEAKKFGRDALSHDNFDIQQDEDVLDTWFSSGLLPLSALGWPHQSLHELPRYPLNLMETGSDIIFFWVARMAMLCRHFSGTEPFNQIYLHGMVRDSQGRKMSKSLGNVIDPMQVIEGVTLAQLEAGLQESNLSASEIQKSRKALQEEYPNGIERCGADALRHALCLFTEQERTINMEAKRLTNSLHFGRKLWNLFKYGYDIFGKEIIDRQSSSGGSARGLSGNASHLLFETDLQERLLAVRSHLTIADRWILSRLASLAKETEGNMEHFRIAAACFEVTQFFVRDFGDTYLSFGKMSHYGNIKSVPDETRQMSLATLMVVMESGLRLLHPFMPFITEELWQHLGRFQRQSHDSISVAPYPSFTRLGNFADPLVDQEMQLLIDCVHACKSLKQSLDISPTREVDFLVVIDEKEHSDFVRDTIERYSAEVKHMLSGNSPLIADRSELEGAIAKQRLVQSLSYGKIGCISVYLSLGTRFGHDELPSVILKLQKRNQKLDKELESLLSRQNAKSYEEKVPEEIRVQEQKRIDELRCRQQDLKQLVDFLKLRKL